MSIAARVEQLERMARAVDSILDDLVVNGDWKTTKQRHGVAPFAETPPAPQPATEGDGKPEDAPADRTRLTLYPSRMCEATRAAFDWIKSHDGGAHGALFTRALSDACAEYAAHLTASLRAEVAIEKAHWETSVRNFNEMRKERDELRAEVEEVKALCERVKDENVKLAAALTNKLEAWSKDPRTVRLCRIMAKAGIRYDYESPAPPKVKPKPARRPARGKGKGVKRGK